MIRRFLARTVCVASLAFFIVAAPVRGQDSSKNSSNSIPSVFNYGWRGLFLGSLAGLSGGYIRYADENNSDEMLKSLAYGALAGAGAGLIVGFLDTSNNSRYGHIVLHDMYRGGGFGLGVGLIWGSINAISKDDSKEIGLGASWGYLAGLVVGIGVAVVENAHAISAPATALRAEAPAPSFALFLDSHRKIAPGLKFAWRY